MDIENLRVFCKTYTCKSISLGAKELYLTQPTVTGKLKALEAELNLILFERNNKGVRPTAAGEVFYVYAENIVSVYDNMRRDLDAYDGNAVKRLSISSCSIFGQYALPCSLYEYKKKVPDIEIQLEQAYSSDIILQVRDRGVDIGFIEGTYSDDVVECIVLGKTQGLFVASPTLIKSDFLLLEDLYRYSLFMSRQESTLRRTVEAAFRQEGIEIGKLQITELPSVESIKSSLVSGLGISVLPYMAIKKELFTKNLTPFSVENIQVEYPYSVIYKKNTAKPCKRDFINYISDEGINYIC